MSKELSDFKDLAEMDVKNLDEFAQVKAEEFVNNQINTNQIRNIFGAIVKMRSEFENSEEGKEYGSIRRSLILLKPKLAYAAARQQKKMEPFRQVFTSLIDLVESSQDKKQAAKTFFDFTEAVVAYHKFYEEKKKSKY